jgi:hypothetical protein
MCNRRKPKCASVSPIKLWLAAFSRMVCRWKPQRHAPMLGSVRRLIRPKDSPRRCHTYPIAGLFPASHRRANRTFRAQTLPRLPTTQAATSRTRRLGEYSKTYVRRGSLTVHERELSERSSLDGSTFEYLRGRYPAQSDRILRPPKCLR